MSYLNPFFLCPAGGNFASIFYQPPKQFAKTMEKIDKPYKYRVTAICVKQISFSRENGKLCLGQPEILRASQDNLPFPYGQGWFPPKSETHYVASKVINRCAIK